MSTYLNRTVSPRDVIDVLVVPPSVARVALAALVLLAAFVVVLGVATRADLPSGPVPSTPGVVVTPHPQPAGY